MRKCTACMNDLRHLLTNSRQFGNMLVLSATYRHPVLKRIVNENKFHRLLQRTITFLRRLAPISPTCQADCGILEKFSNTLFPSAREMPSIYRDEGVEPMSATASFSNPAT